MPCDAQRATHSSDHFQTFIRVWVCAVCSARGTAWAPPPWIQSPALGRGPPTQTQSCAAARSRWIWSGRHTHHIAMSVPSTPTKAVMRMPAHFAVSSSACLLGAMKCALAEGDGRQRQHRRCGDRGKCRKTVVCVTLWTPRYQLFCYTSRRLIFQGTSDKKHAWPGQNIQGGMIGTWRMAKLEPMQPWRPPPKPMKENGAALSSSRGATKRSGSKSSGLQNTCGSRCANAGDVATTWPCTMKHSTVDACCGLEMPTADVTVCMKGVLIQMCMRSGNCPAINCDQPPPAFWQLPYYKNKCTGACLNWRLPSIR